MGIYPVNAFSSMVAFCLELLIAEHLLGRLQSSSGRGGPLKRPRARAAVNPALIRSWTGCLQCASGLPSINSSMATSAAPNRTVSVTSGRRLGPPPPVSCRTRLETMLNQNVGIPNPLQCFVAEFIHLFLSFCAGRFSGDRTGSSATSDGKPTLSEAKPSRGPLFPIPVTCSAAYSLSRIRDVPLVPRAVLNP
jgi:hypothetical protein